MASVLPTLGKAGAAAGAGGSAWNCVAPRVQAFWSLHGQRPTDPNKLGEAAESEPTSANLRPPTSARWNASCIARRLATGPPKTAGRATPSEWVHASEPIRTSTGLKLGRREGSKARAASRTAVAKLAAFLVEMRHSSSRWRARPSSVRKMMEVGKAAMSRGRLMPWGRLLSRCIGLAASAVVGACQEEARAAADDGVVGCDAGSTSERHAATCLLRAYEAAVGSRRLIGRLVS